MKGACEHWVWTSFAPKHCFILADTVGKRTRTECRELINTTSEKIDNDADIVFITDGFTNYETTLKEKYANRIISKKYVRKTKYQEPTQKATEPIPDEVILPDNIHYLKVIKRRYPDGRLKEVEHKLVFGNENKIREIIGCTNEELYYDTNGVERNNLTRRLRIAKLNRKTIRYSKNADILRLQVSLDRMYHNFCWTPASLRQKLTEEEKRGTKKIYRYRTPAMSIGIIDKIWTLKDLLSHSA